MKARNRHSRQGGRIQGGSDGADAHDKAWIEVTDACAWMACVPDWGLSGSEDVVPAKTVDALVRARTLAETDKSRRMPDGGISSGAGLLREGLGVFEAVARVRGRDAWTGLAADLRRAGITVRTGMAGWDDKGCMDAEGLARGLGKVLACLQGGGGRGHEASSVARRVFEGGPLLALFEGAVQIPGAGTAAALGCIRCARQWDKTFRGQQRLAPETVAWLVDGLRLAMDGETREIIENIDFYAPGVFDFDVMEAILASVHGFDGDGIRRYRSTQRAAGGAVQAFNAEAARWLEVVPKPYGNGWQTLHDMRVSDKACRMALDATLALDIALDMRQAALRLSGAEQGSPGERSRRRA